MSLFSASSGHRHTLFVFVNFAGKWEIYDALLVLPGGCEVGLERAR
jgi:hypothetical protein